MHNLKRDYVGRSWEEKNEKKYTLIQFIQQIYIYFLIFNLYISWILFSQFQLQINSALRGRWN